MKLAYLIALHHKPRQFAWLFDALYNETDIFLIHLDRKAPTAVAEPVFRIASGLPNVHFLDRRDVVWAGWSQCQVELDAIAFLLGRDAQWRYFINLSGQDYPLRPRAALVADLAAAEPANYVEVLPVDTLPDYIRWRTRWWWLELHGRVVHLPLPLPRPRRFRNEWKGASWHALARSFCQWALSDSLPRRCFSYLRKVSYPDEFLMQCLVMNGPFRDALVADCRRLVLWEEGRPNPMTLTMAQWPLIEASTAWFGRKFDETADRDVLLRLARRLGAGRRFMALVDKP